MAISVLHGAAHRHARKKVVIIRHHPLFPKPVGAKLEF
jgi:hypothetical protein